MISNEPSRSLMRRWAFPVLWLALTAALILAFRSLPWGRAFAELARVDAAWLGIAVLANFVILPLWAVEWRLLVPGSSRVGFARMFEIISITASVLNSVPFLAGEISAVGLLIARGGLSRGAALSVLAVDQLLVAFAKLAILSLALAIAPLPPWLRAGGLTLVAVLSVSLLLLVPLAHSWARLRDRLLVAPSELRRVIANLVSWGQHLDSLREPRRLWRVCALALLKKSAELGAVIAVQAAFGIGPSFAIGVLVVAALALSTLVPVAPANLGVYEATVFAIYRLGGVAPEIALGIAVLQHLCFLLPSLATGYALLTIRQLRSRPLRVS